MIYRVFVLLLCASLCFLFGCVGQGAYQKKVEESASLAKDLSNAQRRNGELARESESLRTEVSALRVKLGELEEGKKKLEQTLSAKSDAPYQMVVQLEREKSLLTEDLAKLLRTQEDKVRDVSRIYESLLERMKDEIAGGRVTVSELRGTVKIAVLEEALFHGENGELSPGGASILLKLADILKVPRDSEVSVAVPFQIPSAVSTGAAGAGNPSEIPAARAMAVVRFFRQNGIDSDKLDAVARGEFGPNVAHPPAGRFGARRVEITVAEKD
jgi:chemotaxis protein MotB